MKLVWVTSFAKDMLEVSGRPLLNSFRDWAKGDMFLAYEGDDEDASSLGRIDPRIFVHALPDPFLNHWLAQNKEWIPEHLGGAHKGCTCPGGPFDPHAKNHTMPCVGHWFNRNASRWFRKMAALRAAAEKYAPAHPDLVLVWIDADCVFQNPTDERVVKSWLSPDAGVFYHKATRPVLEAGVVGYDFAKGGDTILKWMLDAYLDGRYRGLQRWDDSYLLQKAIEKCDVVAVDLASHVGENAQVIPYGPVGPYVTHRKGKHGRVLGIMK